jgi:hypothetical protein
VNVDDRYVYSFTCIFISERRINEVAAAARREEENDDGGVEEEGEGESMLLLYATACENQLT